jgi:hypothetical protein
MAAGGLISFEDSNELHWAAGGPMTDPKGTPTSLRPLWVLAAAGGMLLAGTLALWAHYGTAVFYEMILAGVALCL